jgi:predicted metalloprotease
MRLIMLTFALVGLVSTACVLPAELTATTAATTTEHKAGSAQGTPKEDRAGPDPNRIEVAVVGPASYELLINDAINDLDLFWADVYPEVYGRPYETIAEFAPYNLGLGDRPTCGDGQFDSEIAVGNAFYCPADDSISWDNEALFPDLYARFGDFAVALVLAHEWGHAVQQRGSVQGPTILRELQADCFAGAWVGSLADRRSDLAVLAEDLDTAAAGFLIFRDPVGIGANSGNAHGNAFDRLGHFGDGLRQGPAYCAELEEIGVAVTEAGFGSLQEQQSGGNLPAEDVIPSLTALLDTYWADLGSDSGFQWSGFENLSLLTSGELLSCSDAAHTLGAVWCRDDDTIHFEVDEVLQPLFEEFGDFGPGMILAQGWALKGASELGLDTSGPAAILRGDCFVGDWASEMVIGIEQVPGDETSRIFLSPGDLDEAIQSLLFLGGVEGLSAFERVEAMRSGFFGGVNACLGG